MIDTKETLSKSRVWRRHRAKLLAGALALSLAGAFSVQTFLPGQLALADPVHVDQSGPRDFSDLVSAVQPAVVSVRVKEEIDEPEGTSFDQFFNFPGLDQLPDNHPLKRFFEERKKQQEQQEKKGPHRYGLAQGSGFFISSDGYLVTNDHVVDKGKEFTVVDNDGKEYDAKLIGTDPRTDLALLKVKADHPFKYVKFSDETPKIGQWVIAIGNPFGLGGTVTAGIVSARGRDIGAGPYDDFLQIDAPVNKGNSGGPAFNAEGEVIGINSAIISPDGGSVGIAFAIPASTAKTVIAQLKDKGHVTRGWLGVQIQSVTDDIAASLGLKEGKGAIVAQILDDGPAGGAGIKDGDVILKVDGKDISGPRDLSKLIAGYAPDTKVDITVWRDGAEKHLSVTLGKMKDTDKVASAEHDTDQHSATKELTDLGLSISSAKAAGAGDEGVVVTDIEGGSVAEDKGLAVGDVISEIAGKKVNDADAAADAIAAAKKAGRKAVLLRISRDGNSRFLALPLTK